MGFLLKKIAQKAAEKATKVDMTDVLSQQTAGDVISIIKAVFF